MLAKTHLVIGALIIVFFYKFLSLTYPVLLLCSALILFFSLAPDLDTGNSSLGKHLWFLNWLVKHRGFFHSLTPVVLLSAVTYVFSPALFYAVLSSYSAHLFADSISKEGITPLWPSKFRIKGFVKVGGVFEFVFRTVLLLVTVGILLVY